MPRRVLLGMLGFLLVFTASCGSGGAFFKDESGGASIALGENPDDTLVWNGFEVVRHDIAQHGTNIPVLDNVLTTEDQELVVFIENPGSDALEYGFAELIQVSLYGKWYTLPYQPPQRNKLLIPGSGSGKNRIEYTIDLSVLGKLPPGKYRLVEGIRCERLQTEWYDFAYFWVIEPGGESPSESETTGEAWLEDVDLSVQSPAEARRQITDRDSMIAVVVELLSGKTYYIENATLEMKSSGIWKRIECKHANGGMQFGLTRESYALFLNEPLAAGQYRLKLSMWTYIGGYKTPQCEFTVVAYEDAPEPRWDASRLALSPYDISIQSTGVRMTLSSRTLNAKNQGLDIVIEADHSYSYGVSCEVEVLLEGKWYRIPYAPASFVIAIAYGVSPNHPKTQAYQPVFDYGVLPAGQYRLVKNFSLLGPDLPGGYTSYLAEEFAVAEFTVEETLDRLLVQ